MYMKVGDGEYQEAELGLSYHELPDGEFIAVRDTQEAIRARQANSHERYFEDLKKSTDPRDVKRTLKKQEALQRQFEILAIDRAVPPAAPSIEIVTDEKFMELRAMYQQAVREGRPKQCEFQPLQSYQNKLVTKSGTVVRPLYQGEVGLLGNRIVCLQQGYGTGASISVPTKVE